MKKLFLFSFILLTGVNLSFAQKAVINNSQAETPIEFSNPEHRCFQINVDLNVMDAVGKNVYVNVYFYNRDRSPLRDSDGSYNTSDGCVATHKVITPGYSNSSYKKLTLRMPLKQLEITQNGERTIIYEIVVTYNGNNINENGTHCNTFTYLRTKEKCPDCTNGYCKTCNGSGRVSTTFTINGRTSQSMVPCYQCCSNGITSSDGLCRTCKLLNSNSGGYLFSKHQVNGKPFINGKPLTEFSDSSTPVTPTPTPSIQGGSGTSRSSGSKERDCMSCRGTGTIVKNIMVSQFGIKNEVKVRCSTCGESHYPSTGHTHIRCGNCNGTGKVKY